MKFNIKPCAIDNIVPNRWYAILGIDEDYQDKFTFTQFSGLPFKILSTCFPYIAYTQEPYIVDSISTLDIRIYDLIRVDDEEYVKDAFALMIKKQRINQLQEKIAQNTQEIKQNLSGKP